MALTQAFSGYYRAHSAIFGNALEISNGGNAGVQYITPVGGMTASALLNGSRSNFSIPPGSTVVFAELVLASMSFPAHTIPNINFKTPVVTTTLPYGTLETGFAGWSIYRQDVTTLVNAGGSGTYEVGAVVGNIQSLLWYIYVAYQNPSFEFKYLYYSRGIQEVISGSPVVVVLNNVFTPSSGPVSSYILLASTGGDTADGATAVVNGTTIGNASVGVWNGLAPYNPRNNIQPGIICFGNTNDPNIGLLDTTGTFGGANNNPYSGVNPNPNRSWVDITGMTIPLANSINSVQLNLRSAAGGYLLNTVAFEITAFIPPAKSVDKQFATVGDTLTYTMVISNSTSVPNTNVTLIDTIPSGTTFVPNSLTVNGATIPGNPSPPSGVNIGTIPVAGTSTVTFQVLVGNTIPSPNPVQNNSTFTLNYGTFSQGLMSNSVSTTISSAILSSSKTGIPFADVGNVLTYTIPISNTGNTSAFNVRFIDTIPNGTNFVANSLKQDVTNVAGSPNPPGVTLPNSIGPGRTSTVTFQVQVVTIPSPNPIPNVATQIYSYTINNTTVPNLVGNTTINTNIFNTQINNASLSNISKSTDKNFVTCGDTITYTITVPNAGNVTANNITLIDTIPSGTSLVDGSVIINGVIQPNGTNPQTGLNLGSINPGGFSTISFRVTVIC